jgi:hypothetical protein
VYSPDEPQSDDSPRRGAAEQLAEQFSEAETHSEEEREESDHRKKRPLASADRKDRGGAAEDPS